MSEKERERNFFFIGHIVATGLNETTTSCRIIPVLCLRLIPLHRSFLYSFFQWSRRRKSHLSCLSHFLYTHRLFVFYIHDLACLFSLYSLLYYTCIYYLLQSLWSFIDKETIRAPFPHWRLSNARVYFSIQWSKCSSVCPSLDLIQVVHCQEMRKLAENFPQRFHLITTIVHKVKHIIIYLYVQMTRTKLN